jgi:hypothetical protein
MQLSSVRNDSTRRLNTQTSSSTTSLSLSNSNGDLLTAHASEIDPLFTAWDKSTGIIITEAQIVPAIDFPVTLTGAEVLTNKTIISPSGLVKADVGLGNVDNTSDVNKPVSTATTTQLDLKEVLVNKSTNVTTDGASDTKYPSVKAVKTYVDTHVGGGTGAHNDTTSKQGGIANEYYHLSNAQYTIATQYATAVRSGYLKDTDFANFSAGLIGGGTAVHSSLANLDYDTAGHTGFLSTALAASTYAPIASPTFTGTVTTPDLLVQKSSNPIITIKDTTSALISSFAIASGAGAYSALSAANDTVFRCYNSYMLFTSQGTDTPGGFRWTTKPSGTELEQMTMLPNGYIGMGFTTPLSKLCINGGLHIGSESAAGDNNLLIDGTIKGESLESVTTFSSGFAGEGYKIIETGGTSSLEVDSLRVRGTLNAYELEINKISSINGGLIVSVANAKATTVSGTTIYFDEGIGLTIPFEVDDYIRAQQFNGTGVASYLGKVTAVNAGNIVATTQAGYDAPYAGMDLVQFGSSSQTDRQSAIYLTAADTNNPYIAGYAGITNGLFTAHEKFRLGNLTGITDAVFGALSGFGLWSDSAYLTGSINATAGRIGGWHIDSTSIHDIAGAVGISSTVTGGDDIRFWAGHTTPTSAPFRITESGALTATGVTEFGTATAVVDGIAQSIAISGPDIWENSSDSDNGTLQFNRLGFNGGGTHYRSATFYNGKDAPDNAKMLIIDGTQDKIIIGAVTHQIDLDVHGTIESSGDIINLGGSHAIDISLNDDTCGLAISDITGFSQTVTPKGNKIYVSFNVPIHPTSANQSVDIYIDMGGTNYFGLTYFVATTVLVANGSTIIDVTPNTAYTIKLRWAGTTGVQYLGSTGTYGIGNLIVLDLF